MKINWEFWKKKPEAPQQPVEEEVVQPPTPAKPQFGLDKAFDVYQKTHGHFGNDEKAHAVVAFIVPLMVDVLGGSNTLAKEAARELDLQNEAEQISIDGTTARAVAYQEQIDRLRREIAVIENEIRDDAARSEAFVAEVRNARSRLEKVTAYFVQ
ncbi:MAG: hypothetical protein WCX97_03665 [Candidatus Magasanikbacteria bacterium]